MKYEVKFTSQFKKDLEFTLDEMKELAKSRDLAPDEMEQAAGGKKTAHREGPPCP